MKRFLLLICILKFIAGDALAAEKDYNVDCSFGWSGCIRPMEWTPVDIRINTFLKEPFDGILHLSCQQDGLNNLTVSQQFVVSPDMSVNVPMITKMAFSAEDCELRLTNPNGRSVWSYKYPLNDYNRSQKGCTIVYDNDSLIGVIGDNKFGLRNLEKQAISKYNSKAHQETYNSDQGSVYVKSKMVNMAPWDWTGYCSIDLLVLYNPDWREFRKDQLEAIVKWVSNGGKLFIIMGSHPFESGNPIGDMLPFKLDEIKECQLDDSLLSTWDLQVNETEAIATWPIAQNDDDTFNYECNKDGICLFASGPIGFGRVGVMTFDPANLSEKQKAASGDFWINRISNTIEDGKELLSARSISKIDKNAKQDENYTNYYQYNPGLASQGSNAVMEYLYNIKELEPLSIWWVILLLTGMAFLLGPIDYIVLKRKGHLPLTWVTSACWILLFTVVAYYGVQALRGGSMQMRVVTLQDSVGLTGHNWQTSYMGMFAPKSDRYYLDLNETGNNQQWFSGACPVEDYMSYYSQRTAMRNIDCIQHDGSNLPYSLPINIWTMQTMMTESKENAFPFRADVQRDNDKLILNITNLSESGITNGFITIKGNMGMPFGEVGPMESKEFILSDKGDMKIKWSYDHLTSGDMYYSQSRRRNSSQRDICTNAFWAQGSLKRTDAMMSYIEKGNAVVCAKYDDMPVPTRIKNVKCEYTHVYMARQVVSID
ncbi:MAG: hypothetical protein JEZ07_05225 [Phycisphaerae bacterium]|nr:hypothetical protein [Phycisphaerae bacterium]